MNTYICDHRTCGCEETVLVKSTVVERFDCSVLHVYRVRLYNAIHEYSIVIILHGYTVLPYICKYVHTILYVLVCIYVCILVER